MVTGVAARTRKIRIKIPPPSPLVLALEVADKQARCWNGPCGDGLALETSVQLISDSRRYGGLHTEALGAVDLGSEAMPSSTLAPGSWFLIPAS